jgi:hypothetical protein
VTAVAPAGAPLAASVRRLLQVAALLVFLAGVQLFLFPRRTDEYFAWTIGSPMTAVFLGASYWSAVGLELVASRSPHWAGARIALPAVFVFTVLTLIVTLVHIDLFHLEAALPLRTRSVAWAWIAIYVVVPLLMVVGHRDQRRIGFEVPSPSGLPTLVRVTLVGLAALLLGLGVALLVAPAWADAVWAWPLTPLTARAVGAWLVGLGVAAGHARLLDDRPSLRALAVTGVVFGVLQAIAVLRHGDELVGGLRTLAFGGVIAVLAAVSAWALWAPAPDPSP